ncbi:MAG: tetratricopeptide repeat protein [Pseudomonadota bacterium]
MPSNTKTIPLLDLPENVLFSAMERAIQHYQQAISLQMNGHLNEAESSYNTAITLNPSFAEAYNNRGTVRYQKGLLEAALRDYEQALQLKSNYPEAFNNLGVVLQLFKRLDESLYCYQRSLALNPNYSEALYNQGTVLNEKGLQEAALECFDKALQIKQFPELWNDRGGVLQDMGKLNEAVESYNQALYLRKDYAEALNNRGIAQQELDRFPEALASFDKALMIKKDYFEAWNNRGNILRDIHHYDESLYCYDQALAIKPDYIEALNNKGYTLHIMARFDKALDYFNMALGLESESVDVELIKQHVQENAHLSSNQEIPKLSQVKAVIFRNRGNTLFALHRYDEALQSFDIASVCNPHYIEALDNKATVLWAMRRFGEALAYYDRAIMREPERIDHRYNKSIGELALGFLKSGWEGYENRLKIKAFREKLSLSSFDNLPRWDGKKSLKGKKILICHEQGMGDALQFSRYANILKQTHDANVILETLVPIKHLMQSLDEGIEIITKSVDAYPDVDFYVPLMSLPYACQTTLKTIPAQVPYLHADSTYLEKWQKQLGEKTDKVRIGLVWAGNPTHRNDHNRSIALEKLLPLTELSLEFYSLQKHTSDHAVQLCLDCGIYDLKEDLLDFSDTAAVIELLDIVITVDTSVAHLAGALAKPVWILLPFMSDWRWLMDREDCPWYPTARLFRQTTPGDWDSVVERLKAALHPYAVENKYS